MSPRRVLLAISLFTLVITPSLFSQIVRSYGFKAGAASAGQSFNYHDLTFPINFDPDRRWGIDAGVFIEFLQIPTASILAEVHYVQKGWSDEFNVTTADGPEIIGTETVRSRLDYISVPVLLKLRLDGESFVPYLAAGPRVDFLIGHIEEYFTPIEYNDVDFGVSVGLGAEIPVGPANALLLEFRYAPTLTNSYEGDFVDVQNSSLELLLGITL